MNVTFSILMWVFGLISADNLFGYLITGKRFSKLEFLIMVMSIAITAVSAGIVYGGLFQ